MRILLRESDVNDPELSNSDKKILSLIHTKVFDNLYGDHTTWDEEDREEIKNLLEKFDEDLLIGIRNFLKTTLHLEEDLITYYAELFFKEYREDGDYKSQLWKQDKDLKFFDLEKKYAEMRDISPLWVINSHDSRYGLPIVYDYTNNQHWAIGDQEESDDAMREYYESAIYDLRDFVDWGGEDIIIRNLYVTHTDKRLLAQDESEYRVGDLDDTELLEEIKNTELGDEYENLEEKLDSLLDDDKDTSEVEKRMSRIIELAKEKTKERFYDEMFGRLDEELEDYLWEMGYITDKDGKWEFGDNLRSRGRGGLHTYFDPDLLPSWLNVDEDEIINELVKNSDYEVISDHGYYDWFKDENGDIYYIYDIDY